MIRDAINALRELWEDLRGPKKPRARFGPIYCADCGMFLRWGWSRHRMDGRLIDRHEGECPAKGQGQ